MPFVFHYTLLIKKVKRENTKSQVNGKKSIKYYFALVAVKQRESDPAPYCNII